MKIARPHRHKVSEAGFTLAETLVVLVIVSLAAVLALPSVIGSSRGQALRSAAIDLASALQSARATAMRLNTEETLTIDAASRTIETAGRAPAAIVSGPIDIDLLTIRSEQTSPTAGRLRFYPDGSSTGGRVVLREGRRQAVVAVDWLTGGTRVEIGH